MYGYPKSGLLGSQSRALVDARSEEEKMREAQALGIDPTTYRRMQGMTAQDSPMPAQPMAQPRQPIDIGDGMPQEKPTSYWQGGKKFGWREGIAGALAGISDIAAQQNGMQGQALGNLMGGRNQALEAAQSAQAAAMKRQQEMQDYEARKQVDQRYAAPPNNDTVNDYNFIREKLGPDAAEQYLRNVGDPMVNMTLPGDRFYSGPRSQIGSALGAGGGGSATPSPGDVVDGYRYKGGNLSDKNNWEPVAAGGAGYGQPGFR